MIQLNIPQITIIVFTWLVGITLAVILYLVVLVAFITVIQGIRWLLRGDKDDVQRG